MDHVAVARRLLAELDLLGHRFEEDLPKLIELTEYKISLRVMISMNGGSLPKRPEFLPNIFQTAGFA